MTRRRLSVFAPALALFVTCTAQGYGKAAIDSVRPSGDDIFWTKIALLADRASRGTRALQEVWPTPSASLHREQQGAIVSLFGDKARLSEGVAVERSEIRLRSSDPEKVVLASLSLAGVCIGLNEVRAHYPTIVVTDVANPGVPDGAVSWTAYGERGGLWFSFPVDHPTCLSGVSFHPGEIDAPSGRYGY